VSFFQISYYRLPLEERVDSQDHTPELDFDTDFDGCLDRVQQLRAQGYYDISLDEYKDGSCVESICIASYVDEWGAV
jgi:hypothetical protein|tara:strand:+ start:554 stop:784 length:231 start_codon:yes stop_codon:yes gene_type:complete